MTKYAVINPLDDSVFLIQDVMAASDIHITTGAPYIVPCGDDVAADYIYDKDTGTFSPNPPPIEGARKAKQPEPKAEPATRPSHTYSKRDD